MPKKKTKESKTEKKAKANPKADGEPRVELKTPPAAPPIPKGKVRAPKKKKGKKSHGRAYLEASRKVNPDKFYPLLEAIKLAGETAFAKFDASLEAHFNLGIDPSKDEQKVRTTVVLPHGTGKEKKVLAFVSQGLVKSAEQAGADLIGDEAKIEEIGKGVIDFDVVVAEPSFMVKLAKVAKVLGPKGLMPNPKSGTISSDPIKSIKEIKKGKVELKNQTDAPLLHTVIGKKSFETKQLYENFLAVYNALKSTKPAKTKGVFIEAVSLSASMGPSIKVDLSSLD